MTSHTSSSTSSNPTRSPEQASDDPTIEHNALPVLPLPDGVVLPDMVVTIAIQSNEAREALDAAVDDRLLLVPRLTDAFATEAGADSDASTRGEAGRYAPIGVLGTIEDRGTLPDGTSALTVRSHQRLRVGTGVIGVRAGLWVETEAVDESPSDPTIDLEQLAHDYRTAAQALLKKLGGRRLAGALSDISDPGTLADSIGYWPELALDQRVELLETLPVDDRLVLATNWVKEALTEFEVTEQIQSDVSAEIDKGQREAILRRQLSAIQTELGDGEADALAEYRARLGELDASEAVPSTTVEAITKEIDRLERTGNESMEANWIRTWLDSVFELPWGVRSEDRLDLDGARNILDADHTGLDDVKDRLIEHLAVRKLRADRGIADNPDDRRRGVILSLVGPPGVGKTSLGASVARSLDRSFVRLALGGVRDEAEIRGHRRTYVGARPGRLVRALIEAGSMNPVILLDEVDKLGNDYRGDPSSALLEVLDPAQNQTFRDHYLEFELDLSDVVFIATANVVDTIPGPLLDRMEVITVDGYSEREKATIAADHLLPRLLRSNGLEADEVTFTDDAIKKIASDYTVEAGVRQLERLLDKAVRKTVTGIATAKQTAPIAIEPNDLDDLLGRPIPRESAVDRVDRPGVATGLAVTGAGGDVLFVETALVPGEGDPMLTGQLGDVMKESASIARSLVSSLTEDLAVEFPEGHRFHVHFPAGGVPKDGPSAGITMCTALISLLTGRQVRPEVAMTGEVSLQGRVLPIGGVKQKVLAAHRAGITHVLLPEGNRRDLEDVPSDIVESLNVSFVSEIREVLELALQPVAAR